MKVEDSNIIDLVKKNHSCKEGNYYFFDCFVIAEINAGVTYSWEVAKKVIDVVEEFYGKNAAIGYVTNRINDYSIKPTDWLKFHKNNHKITCYAIVSNTKQGIFNAAIENLFLKDVTVERFTDLHDAINWTKQMTLNECLKRKSQ